MSCSCLACVMHFGKCSSVDPPRLDGMSAIISADLSDSYGGITAFGDLYRVAPYRSDGWMFAHEPDETVYILNRDYVGGVRHDGKAWGNLDTNFTEEAL